MKFLIREISHILKSNSVENSNYHEEHRDRIGQLENNLKDQAVQNCNAVALKTDASIRKASREQRNDFCRLEQRFQELSNAIPNNTMQRSEIEESFTRVLTSDALAKAMIQTVISASAFRDDQDKTGQQACLYPTRRRSLNARKAGFLISRGETSFFNYVLSIQRIIRKSENTLFMKAEDLETQTTIRFHPPWWLVKFGFSYGLNLDFTQCHRGWKHSLETFRCVPDDSLVFELCASGNVQGVETIIRMGKASVWDTNSSGITPLHVCEYCFMKTEYLCC